MTEQVTIRNHIGTQLATHHLAEGVGRVIDPGRIGVDAAPKCENPVGFDNWYPPLRTDSNSKVRAWEPGDPAFIRVEGFGRCRKCPPCLAYRKRLWTFRALAETSQHPRTWFGTLTLRPERQSYYRNVARRTARATVVSISAEGAPAFDDFETHDDDVQFREHVQAISPAITRYIKRVREQSGAKVRYLLVAEAHESGDPHFHMLLHEVTVLDAVRKRVLQGQWHEGYSSWKLADAKTAYYVCKYIGKDARTRVRASCAYGSGGVVEAALDTIYNHRVLGTLDTREEKRMTPHVQPNDGA